MSSEEVVIKKATSDKEIASALTRNSLFIEQYRAKGFLPTSDVAPTMTSALSEKLKNISEHDLRDGETKVPGGYIMWSATWRRNLMSAECSTSENSEENLEENSCNTLSP